MLDLVGQRAEPRLASAGDAAQAAAQHLDSGGRRLRARAALYAARCLGLPEDDGVCIAAAVELLHNASLVHDDLQDRAAFRRGAPAVWTEYSTDVAICAGDLLLSAASAALCGIGTPHLLPRMLRLVHERVQRVIQGQCADLSLPRAATIGIDRYEQIAMAKTGPFFSLPTELCLLASGHDAAMPQARVAAEMFALAYQIADDFDDIDEDAACAGHGALNAVMEMRASGHVHDARARTRALAHLRLDSAVAAARTLPSDCGAMIAHLALDLRARLDMVADADPATAG